ncbi:aminotransferase class V-fold PLP-dependent enzyme [Paracoccus aurantiacus]|uniref:Aminotransferase class V-fold PLP-dependent enzyme n=1 Tax=Paracoccus aurantiacus TaxID=2599412 RepID=A0A5C6S8H5_9RHOB|nr:beta-eliminating lyase-related protein [Paracoccus aurantiacus]TXB71149.1 aminotransferase class V-fold PLP-dependent enzyme [Paracoccus aurantiacus]
MNFASDNASGVHPAVMAAMAAADDGYVLGYGNDALTQAAQERVREALEAPEAAVFFVTTGTAANAIGLGAAVQPWQRIFCHEDAHIETSECAAPELFTAGAKLTLMPGEGGLIDADALDHAAEFWAGEGLGGGKPGAVSITNSTEWGRVWMPETLGEIAAVARQHGLVFHMDGARFANAVAGSSQAPADITHRAGVDLLSFGGTKNGAMGAEAIVAFDPAIAERMAYMRKRGGHLWSKHRYLAAQFYALLEGDLWLQLAGHANAMATRLSAGLAQVDGARLLQPVESNQVFVTLPGDADDRARAAGANYYKWTSLGEASADEVTLRFVCSWNTREAEIEALIAALQG